jgi:hypothetical protein
VTTSGVPAATIVAYTSSSNAAAVSPDASCGIP